LCNVVLPRVRGLGPCLSGQSLCKSAFRRGVPNRSADNPWSRVRIPERPQNPRIVRTLARTIVVLRDFFISEMKLLCGRNLQDRCFTLKDYAYSVANKRQYSIGSDAARDSWGVELHELPRHFR
jgi:hypothetical protein